MTEQELQEIKERARDGAKKVRPFSAIEDRDKLLRYVEELKLSIQEVGRERDSLRANFATVYACCHGEVVALELAAQREGSALLRMLHKGIRDSRFVALSLDSSLSSPTSVASEVSNG